jgi:hypothetical protein
MMQNLKDPELVERLLSRTPLKRLAQPEDVSGRFGPGHMARGGKRNAHAIVEGWNGVTYPYISFVPGLNAGFGKLWKSSNPRKTLLQKRFTWLGI